MASTQEPRSWVRTRIAAAAAVTTVATVAAASIAAGPSAAAPSSPAVSSGAAVPSVAAQTDTGPRGTAKAVGVVARVAPGVGGLELATELGVAVTDVTNAVAQAQGKTLDLGLIGTSLTADGCSDAAFRPEDLPQATRVDNRGGDASLTTEEVPAGAATAGRVRVEATTKPSSRAVATTGTVGADGVVSLSSGRADASTEIDPATGIREARAVVEVDLDIAGVVQLKGMRWTARHRTGAEESASGTFEVASVAALGVPLPIDEIEPLQAAINEALALTGVRIELPRVVRITEPTDLIRVTPLRVAIQDSPLGATLLGPVLEGTRVARSQLFDVLTESICEAAGALLVGDILMSIVAGTGRLALEVGGAEAISGDMLLANPFGEFTPAAPTVADDVVEPPPPPPAPAATDPTPPPPTSEAPAGDEQAANLPAAPVSAVEQLCESVHPFRWPSCSNGAAMPLALLGLGATAAMAALDWRHQRRRMGPVEIAGGAA